MERLTEKTIGCFEYRLKDHKSIPGDFGTYDAFFDYSMAIKRLGEYEDTEEGRLAIIARQDARIEALEGANEDLAHIIQMVAHNRCDYCIYGDSPCPARGLNAECSFEYAEKAGERNDNR